jgi:hypothetical protein
MATRPLRELARIIRSKNAGPFELTLDVMFDDPDRYESFKRSGALNAVTIRKLYGLATDERVDTYFVDAALAFKATFARPISSGSCGDTDVFGSQQHAPLLDLPVPV